MNGTPSGEKDALPLAGGSPEGVGMTADGHPARAGAASHARELFRLVRTAVLALAVVALLQRFVFNLSIVEGQSMQPTLSEGDWLLVNKMAMSMSSPHHGDVMIIRDPQRPDGSSVYLVKRVIGLPGDVIEIRGGSLYLNGEKLEEAYAGGDRTEGVFPPLTVGKDKLFVMGDNRLPLASRDSRAFGLVDEDDVRGRAEFVLWPAGHIDKL